MNKILFVGSNPSCSSPDNSAFNLSTSSRKILDSWLRELGNDIVVAHCNVSPYKTIGNRPLSAAEIKRALPELLTLINEHADFKVVALGHAAARALTLLRITFHAMPHPSGRNRKLNDKSYTAEKIKGLKNYVLSPFPTPKLT